VATTKRRNPARPRNAISSMQRPLNRTSKVCCANGTGNSVHRREQLYREWISDSPPQSLTLRYTSLRVCCEYWRRKKEKNAVGRGLRMKSGGYNGGKGSCQPLVVVVRNRYHYTTTTTGCWGVTTTTTTTTTTANSMSVIGRGLRNMVDKHCHFYLPVDNKHYYWLAAARAWSCVVVVERGSGRYAW
jgi:hypothetical protein